MQHEGGEDITALLKAWSGGDGTALEKLIPLVYGELRRIARRHVAREPSGQSLQSTELIHEAYLRLVDMREAGWQERSHFFAVAAQAMRRILVDRARARGRAKRGGGKARMPMDEAAAVVREPSIDILAVDKALTALSTLNSRKAQVVELRFFAGLSIQETAEVLRISPESVLRDWKLARLWLMRELRG